MIRYQTFKSKMQARVRDITDSHTIWFPCAVTLGAILCFFFMCATAWYAPRAMKNITEKDYPNEGMQLSFTGDTMMARYIKERADAGEGYDPVLADVKNVWANSDFTFTNLEYTVLTEETQDAKATQDKKVVLDGDPRSIQALLNNKINVFGIANNHSTDYGTEALDGEIAYLDRINANFAGYVLTEDAMPEYQGALLKLYTRFQEQPYTKLTCKNGAEIGFIAAVDTGTSETPLSKRILKTSTGELYDYVHTAKEENDLVVVYLHCGSENTLGVENVQKEYAYALIDAGADIIIESHAHAILPVEKYENGIIFYGMGNFIMDQEQFAERDSMIVQYNADSEGNGYFEIIPCHINNGYTQVTTNELFIKRINSIMTRYLSDGEYEINEKGHIIIPWNFERKNEG